MKKTQNHKKHISLKIEVEKEDRLGEGDYVDDLLGVIFPYKPYDEQIKIIRQIHLALKTNSCALIESPTGTGKTLCLLIGCLSYFYTHKLQSKIYYVTRTHSQINQIVGELKKTAYKCKMTIIGSRELMCINNSLKSIKGKLLDRKCEQYCSKGMCRYQSDFDLDLPFLDLHQLKELGKKKSFCPYYYSRQKEQQSQIVILPYNYFLNYNLFNKNSFNIKDSVIIFDEAHNVDQISQEGCSVSITSDLLSKVSVSLKQYIKSFENHNEKKKTIKFNQIQRTFSFFSIIQNIAKSLREHSDCMIFQSFKQFLSYLNQASKAKQNQFFPHGLTISTIRELVNIGKQIAFRMKIGNFSYSCVEELASYLEDMVSIMAEQDDTLFEVSIVCTEQSYKILFLCLSASFIFSKIHQKKPRSIILASGTLNPLNYWQQQVGLNFHIKHTAQSFITQSHLYSHIVSKYREHQFDFSFIKRTNETQIEKLFEFIEDICNSVPNGIIVAFSSYQLMELALQSHGMLKSKYKFFWQSKSCQSESLISQYSEEARKHGAILFMVMRGRLSEGIDFHDQLCRAMIIVGIPFPPINDPKLQAKRRFINKRSQSSITYDRWYMIQASRVVNQAIGRVIRHINDYGCVFLLDKKYENGQIRQYLPVWLLKSMRSFFSIHGITNFMKRIKVQQPINSLEFHNPKKLLILEENHLQEQPTMKRKIHVKISPAHQESISSDTIQLSSQSQLVLPFFPEKPIKKKKQLTDIVFKKYLPEMEQSKQNIDTI